MNSRILLAFVLLVPVFLPRETHAQFEYSIFGGVNVASLLGDDTMREEMPPRNRTTLGGGISFSTFHASVINFRFELVYTQKGARYIGVGEPITHALSCIELPALGVFKLDSNRPVVPKFFLGPYFSINVGAKLQSDEGTQDLQGETMRSETGMMLGVGVDVVERIELLLRYSWSLMTIHRIQDIDIRTRNVQLFAGFLL